MLLHVLLLKTGQDAWQWDSDYTVHVFETSEQLNDFLEREIERLYEEYIGFVTDETVRENMIGDVVDVLEIQTADTYLPQPTNNK
jgi:5-methylthioribose kinase|tara:strand:- start:1062 stop:1316 length:255 start_codon:yes stop_codon:yes gene_type:complete